MSRFTRAILGAVIAAAALPAAANAATLQVDTGKTQVPFRFLYLAAPGEVNTLRVSQAGDGTTFIDDTVPIRISGDSSLDGCRLEADGDAVCAPNVNPFEFRLGDRNDQITYTGADPVLGGINAGDGNDMIFAGIRRGPNAQAAPGVLPISGGAGTGDTVSYRFSQFGATVSLDGQPNDGHLVDDQNVKSDIENVEGSSHADTITGSNTDERERFTGGTGNDTISGLGGSDVFHEGSAPDGADDYNGGSGIDLVDYSLRNAAVNVSLDLQANDGAPGENDFVDPNVNDVFGSQVADTITGSSGANTIRGFGGGDTISGGGSNDTLDGGTGADRLFGEDGDDTLQTADNTPDEEMSCGAGTADTLNRDLKDVNATNCETVNSVGTLRLAPKTIKAQAGKPAHVRLSWRHPVSWRKLRKVELRLTQAGASVGEVTIRPHAQQMTADGAVELMRKHSRLTHKGKTVTARLGLRLDDSLAGHTLKAEVEATDTRGASQVDSAAAKVRVAR
jgi:Ca2+-binding RTX toxin-like protein